MLRHVPVAPPMKTRRPNAAVPEAPEEESPTSPSEVPRRIRKAAAPPRIELGPIIKSKIQPPALRASTLTRQRLIDRLEQATKNRLTLLVAEAGYGKTTLLADFAVQSRIRTMWYRLDGSDVDVVNWTNYLVAAARELDAHFGTATVELLGEIRTGGPPKDAFVASLISELASLDARPTVLVLDDFHLIDGQPAAVEFVRRLLKDAPPWLRIVISSRRRPELEIGKLASEANFAEIGTDDLRFSYEELRELFETAFPVSLDDEVLRSVADKTRGWVASLQLFYQSIQGRPANEVRLLARALSGASSPVYDFLAEEVLTNLSPGLERLLVRMSILDSISTPAAAALCDDERPELGDNHVLALIDEADRLGLLTRSSKFSDVRELHPLLRDFLFRQLTQRESARTIQSMHLRVAAAVADQDFLASARHYVEAGAHTEAMRVLSASVVATVGTGRWGEAGELLNEIKHVPADAGIAAIRARQFLAQNDHDAATLALSGVDVSGAEPAVRAIFRHTQFSVGWHTGDRELMFRALTEIVLDGETPKVLDQIAHIYLDSSSAATRPAPLPALARRLHELADTMATERLTYYSAIALHDSAVAHLNAGELRNAVEVGTEALERFSGLSFFAPEQLSTHAALAVCEQELGNVSMSDAHRTTALSLGREFADVPAELAFLALLLGRNGASSQLLTRARVQQRLDQTDTVADALVECATAASELRTDAAGAAIRLEMASFDSPLELGYSLARDALRAQAVLLAGRDDEAREIAADSLVAARARKARRAEVRLAVVHSLANKDATGIRVSLADAERVGELAVLELADALLMHIDLLVPTPGEIDRSIRRHPGRWLPSIRRQLERGNTSNARAAAALLDAHGTLEDVGLLRAYAKTYAKRGPGKDLGVSLARRTSPPLQVHDLGPVQLAIGDRNVRMSAMRRKPAAVLMYLITRPGFAANREQVVDELWPETDPISGSNNLNQSLYFLRRELDPWYEDDVSVDYVELQGDIVWLDRQFVRADSAAFLAACMSRPNSTAEAVNLVESYTGPFAPEFEYEEWAMAWRSRVHAAFLALAYSATADLVRSNELPAARDVAAHVLAVDPSAADIERQLMWIYGRMGLMSAARSLHEHIDHQDRADGLATTALTEILEGPFPTSG